MLIVILKTLFYKLSIALFGIECKRLVYFNWSTL